MAEPGKDVRVSYDRTSYASGTSLLKKRLCGSQLAVTPDMELTESKSTIAIGIFVFNPGS
jgi:hypothetical protein